MAEQRGSGGGSGSGQSRGGDRGRPQRSGASRPRFGEKPKFGDKPDKPRAGERPRPADRPRDGEQPRARAPRSGESQGGQPRTGEDRPYRKPEQRSSTYLRPLTRGSRPPQDSAVGREHKLAPLPDALPEMLDRSVLRDLKSLTPENAETVAKHLVSAGMLIDEEPERALAHAQAARSSAARIAVVREAVGICAYSAGQWQLALAELRAVKRMTGSWEHIAILADCERALGRARKALDLAAEVPRSAHLSSEVEIELAIVVSGARRDLGEGAAAVVALQGPMLDAASVEPWTPRLWYAHAEALLAAGRVEEARQRFAQVAAIDDEGETDAEERLAAWPQA